MWIAQRLAKRNGIGKIIFKCGSPYAAVHWQFGKQIVQGFLVCHGAAKIRQFVFIIACGERRSASGRLLFIAYKNAEGLTLLSLRRFYKLCLLVRHFKIHIEGYYLFIIRIW